MEENIPVHGNPNNSVFGLLGNDVSTDEGKFYVKISDDSKNKGWREILPTPTPTQTTTVTPSKTMIVTRTATSVPPSATPTISVTPSVTSTNAPNITRTQTPTPTDTPFKTAIRYTIVSTGPGVANRIDGPSPTGTLTGASRFMTLQAIPNQGNHFKNWSVPESVTLSNPYVLNPEAYGFDTYQDVTITANFGTGPLPQYKINAIASSRGTVSFNYINEVGEEIEFYESGFPPGATLVGLVCGYIVTSGNAYITTASC